MRQTYKARGLDFTLGAKMALRPGKPVGGEEASSQPEHATAGRQFLPSPGVGRRALANEGARQWHTKNYALAELGLLRAAHIRPQFLCFTQIDVDDFSLFFVGVHVQQDADAAWQAAGDGNLGCTQ